MDKDRPKENEKCRVPHCKSRAETYVKWGSLEKMEVCGLHAAAIKASKATRTKG